MTKKEYDKENDGKNQKDINNINDNDINNKNKESKKVIMSKFN